MRKVGLGFPPDVIIHGQARMPQLQRITSAVTRSTRGSMMTRDSLRIGNPRTCYGYLASPQIFTRPLLQSGVNSPISMASGLRLANAPRNVPTTRGQSAGM